jgi:hypothetical protein
LGAGVEIARRKNKITYNEMDRACGMYGLTQRWVQPFYGESKEKSTLRMPKRSLNDNIKMDVQGIILEGRGLD